MLNDDTRIMANAVLGVVGLIAVGWLLVNLVMTGWANTVDRIAWWLHTYAIKTRNRHQRASIAMHMEWAIDRTDTWKQLEQTKERVES